MDRLNKLAACVDTGRAQRKGSSALERYAAALSPACELQ